MTADRIRVLIVDDHRVVREGLRAMLRRSPRVEVVGEAEDGATSMAAVSSIAPDVVLLDVKLGAENGLEVCRRLTARHPEAKVIFLTVYEDEQYVLEALRAGARGYVLKSVSREDLLRIVQEVHAGGVIVDPAISGQIALRAASFLGERDWPGADFLLTQREGEILTHLAKGLDNHQISQVLSVSDETVKSHVKAILRKLRARDRAMAVSIAFRHGLVR